MKLCKAGIQWKLKDFFTDLVSWQTHKKTPNKTNKI